MASAHTVAPNINMAPQGLLRAAAAAASAASVAALNNGLALTPPMGFSSWFTGSETSSTGCLTPPQWAETLAAFEATGLRAAGYVTMGMDCYWRLGRAANGTWLPNPDIVPDGMAAWVAAVHGAGFRAWEYTDRGTADCSGVPGTGSEGWEAHDAAWFAAIGTDFVKSDSCSCVGGAAGGATGGAAGRGAGRAACRAGTRGAALPSRRSPLSPEMPTPGSPPLPASRSLQRAGQ
jgi:hypothetical protein